MWRDANFLFLFVAICTITAGVFPDEETTYRRFSYSQEIQWATNDPEDTGTTWFTLAGEISVRKMPHLDGKVKMFFSNFTETVHLPIERGTTSSTEIPIGRVIYATPSSQHGVFTDIFGVDEKTAHLVYFAARLFEISTAVSQETSLDVFPITENVKYGVWTCPVKFEFELYILFYTIYQSFSSADCSNQHTRHSQWRPGGATVQKEARIQQFSSRNFDLESLYKAELWQGIGLQQRQSSYRRPKAAGGDGYLIVKQRVTFEEDVELDNLPQVWLESFSVNEDLDFKSSLVNPWAKEKVKEYERQLNRFGQGDEIEQLERIFGRN